MPVKAPYMIYRAFTGEKVYHWTWWLSFYVALSVGWQAVFSIYHDGFDSTVVVILFLGGVALGLISWVRTLILNIASGPLAFLNWMPGQGKLRAYIGGNAPVTAPVGAGAAKADETLLRGAAVLPSHVVSNTIKQGLSASELDDAFQWGGVPIPPKVETEHFLVEGKTGSGKTQAINAMMRKVRHRNQAAIVADPAGGYLGRFGRDGDLVLNPFDKRSVQWSPYAEITHDYDYRRIAKAAIPDGVGEDAKWTTDAQVLFAECMRVLHKRGETSIKKLLYYVTVADRGELADLLGESPASVLTKQGNERMLGSVRSSAGTPLANWVYLPDNGTFSVRQWVRESDEKRTWLFMTYTDAQMAELRNLVACWLELAIVEGLSLEESQSRRLWYVMDELDSLGKVSSLRGGLTKLRKYGGVCVSGLQTIAQLRATYGHDEAQTLLSCMTTKLILKAGDGETAKYFEHEIGQQEIEREERNQGTSQQFGNLASNNTNSGVRRHVQSAVLASEIMGLENLNGYLMLTGLPIARVQLEYVPMPTVNALYEAK
jgi:type IV secretory pathway TraG/TraD family ATPase VirD4